MATALATAAPACGGSGSGTNDGSDGAASDASRLAQDSSAGGPDSADDGARLAEAGTVTDGALPNDGAPVSDAPSDARSAEGGFAEAPHATPIIPSQGGPVLAAPELVAITYADDSNRATEEAIAAFLPQSQWLLTTGKEYGVGAGTSAKVELSQDAPASIDDKTIQSFIAGLITAGTAPDPLADGGAGQDDGSAGDGGAVSSAVYMIFIPTTTSVSFGSSALCDISSGGYHYESSVQANGHSFVYAVVSPCAMGVPASPPQNIAWVASHEFIESCTDPYPVTAPGYLITDTSQPWASVGGEVGDLCTFVLPQWSEGPYTALQRVYSDKSAQAGGSPCIPVPEPYYGTDVEPQVWQALVAGQPTTFQVTAWSTAPVAPWTLAAAGYAVQGSGTPTVKLGATTVSNGATTTLTVTMPAGTPSQTYVEVFVYSEQSTTDYTAAVVGVYVP